MKQFNKMMQSIMKHKANNAGSTLLTVIICIAFIGILCSLMLSLTLTNLQMKLAESKSKTTFYSDETSMEKIRTSVQEIASQAISDVYTNDVLVNYASYLANNEDKRNQVNQDICDKVIVQFLNTVCSNVVQSTDNKTVINSAPTEGYPLNKNYFISKGYLSSDECKYMDTVTVSCDKNSGNAYAIRLNNVNVSYENQGYRSSISSDIVITIPKFSFLEDSVSTQTTYTMKQPFPQYVLVADGAINSDVMSSLGDTTSIQGNVYSGSGININGEQKSNHTVNIFGNTIITRGDIKVGDTATLNLGTSPSLANIWANNLLTYTSDNYTTGNTNLNVYGICAIKDDLSLDGLNSKASVNGAYIGYTGNHDRSGSSIIINGSGSSLDLSNLQELILAGRANVSVQDLAINKDVNITTGESLAFKSNQRAYLMPASFITGINHNPITESDTLTTVNVTNTPDINYQSYVAATPAPPYKIAVKKAGLTVLRYYFLNFASGWQADSYFYKYYTNTNPVYCSTLQNMQPFSLGSVKLPTDAAAIKAVGNVMSYDSTNGVQLKAGLSATYSDDTSLDTYMMSGFTLNRPVYNGTLMNGKMLKDLPGLYSNLSYLLDMSSTRTYSDGATVKSIMKGQISYVADDTNNVVLNTAEAANYSYHRVKANVVDSVINTTGDPKEQFWVVDDNVTIGSNFTGILITSGDITISNGVTINGLLICAGHTITVGNNVTLTGRIITTGDINLGQGCNLKIDTNMENHLDSIFKLEGTFFNYIFKNAVMTVNSTVVSQPDNLVDLSSMVSYENWRKNE